MNHNYSLVLTILNTIHSQHSLGQKNNSKTTTEMTNQNGSLLIHY
jgi:hypothetical protein